MAQFNWIFTAVILLSIPLDISESCSCYPSHTQEIFCSSYTDIVIKAVILSEKHKVNQNISREDEHIFGRKYYISYITKIYKGEKLLWKLLSHENQTTYVNPRHQKAMLFTASSSGTCGVTLKKGMKYLLSGSVIRGRIEISICDWIAPFYRLSRQQKYGIKGGYDCSCKLGECANGKYPCEMPSNKCEWNRNLAASITETACDLEHRMCKSMRGKCLWFEDAFYEPCIMKHAFNVMHKSDVKYRHSKKTTNQDLV